MGRARERLERKCAPLARRAAGHLRPRAGRVFLGDGVPFTAGVTLALPATIDRAAVLADETRFATGHRSDHHSFTAGVPAAARCEAHADGGLRLRRLDQVATRTSHRRIGLRTRCAVPTPSHPPLYTR